MNNNILKGHAFTLTANILWGLMAPISKDTLNYFAENDISAFTLAAMRMIGGCVAFWILQCFLPKEKTSWSDKGKFFICAMLAIVFNQCLFIVGIAFTSPIDASVITTLMPIITMILAAVIIKEPITGLKAIGVLLGMSGALLLILGGGGSLSFDNDSIIGDIMCLTAQVCFASYLVFFKGFISHFTSVTLMKWMFLSAAIVIVPFAIPNIMNIDFAAIPAKIYLEIGYTVFVATFFTYLLIPTGQKYLRPTVVSMYNYVQPVISSTVALLWGLTTFGLVKGIAIGLVFSGVYIVTQSKSRKQVEQQNNR